MRNDLQEQLFQNHPLVFTGHIDPASDLGRYGIRCGDGWYRLLDAFCAELGPMLEDVARLSSHPRLYAIEERQGRLYVLLRPLTGRMDALIREASDVSERICAACGAAKDQTEHRCASIAE